jgi:hypothetical protein
LREFCSEEGAFLSKTEVESLIVQHGVVRLEDEEWKGKIGTLRLNLKR